jgi:hypothetical protein
MTTLSPRYLHRSLRFRCQHQCLDFLTRQSDTPSLATMAISACTYAKVKAPTISYRSFFCLSRTQTPRREGKVKQICASAAVAINACDIVTAQPFDSSLRLLNMPASEVISACVSTPVRATTACFMFLQFGSRVSVRHLHFTFMKVTQSAFALCATLVCIKCTPSRNGTSTTASLACVSAKAFS